jgi:hypothetical protein
MRITAAHSYRLSHLEGFVKVETEVGEDDPELLPAVAVLELAEQVAGQLIFQRPLLLKIVNNASIRGGGGIGKCFTAGLTAGITYAHSRPREKKNLAQLLTIVYFCVIMAPSTTTCFAVKIVPVGSALLVFCGNHQNENIKYYLK